MKCKYDFCFMQILLIAATKAEVDFFTAKHPGITVLITGVGTPATMYHLQKKMQQTKYDLILQAGIAGSFISGLKLADTVLVKQDTFGDLGVEEKDDFKTLFDIGFEDANAFPFTDGSLVNHHPLLTTTGLPSVKAITVNKVSDSILMRQQLNIKFKAEIESMEGAALHYICLQEKIPFLQIRSISNYVGDRNKNNWKIKEAIASLNTALSQIVQNLIHEL